MPDQWDWTVHTTYEFRTKRIRARFRYRFVRELFDFTMEQAVDFLETRQRETDLVFGTNPQRAKHVATMAEVFRKASAARVGHLSELVDQVLSRDRAAEFVGRTGIAVENLKTTLVEIDYVMLPTQKSMRLLVAKSDTTRNAHIDKLVEQGLGNNLALLDGARTAAQRRKLCRATGIPERELLDLVHRADMGRQHCMARMVDDFYEAGCNTMEAFRATDPEKARKAGIDLGRVIYARTRPRVVEGVPKRRMPRLTQRRAQPRPAGCGNDCAPCTGPYGCVFEKCVRRNGVPSCAHCSAFPCDAYDGGRGSAHLRKVKARLKPSQIVPMKPLRAERPEVVGFPGGLQLPGKQRAALRHVHGLLVELRRVTSGNSYARRQMMQLTRRQAFDVLWSMTHHGELVSKPRLHLYLRKGTCKRNGHHMPDPHAHVFERLALPGLTVEERHPSVGAARRIEDDELRIFLDASAGGPGALRMLRRLGDALCQRYGEPEWKGHCRWKGEAFQRFVAADLTCLARTSGGKGKTSGAGGRPRSAD